MFADGGGEAGRRAILLSRVVIIFIRIVGFLDGGWTEIFGFYYHYIEQEKLTVMF